VPTRRTSPVRTVLVTGTPSSTGRRDRNGTKGRPHPAAHHRT